MKEHLLPWVRKSVKSYNKEVMRMKTNNFFKTLASNMLYAYSSQAISTLIGLSFTMLIPKVLGVEGYGYWQLIVFYATYLGVFYLGINDGIYLRNGGKELDEINKPVVAKICKCFFAIHSFIGLLIAISTVFLVPDKNRAFVLIATACYLPLFNIKGILGQVMQAANNTKVTSIANLFDRIVVFMAVIVGFVLKITDFKYYVVFYVVGGFFAASYCCYQARQILCSREKSDVKLGYEIKEDIKAGIPLMVSSFSALMITGVSRQIIDMRWEISAFSKISLALTMMNLVLVFLNQSSLVLFPAIRKIGQSSQTELYTSLNRLINIIVPVVLVCYVPIGKLVNAWLPEYHESIAFLGVLLPICIWDGKMNLLNNTYYKVLRMEKQLLVINIGTLILNSLFGIIGAYIFGNVNSIAYGLLVSITCRSLVSEVILQKKLGKNFDISVVIPIFSSVLYIAFNTILPGWRAFVAYAVLYGLIFAFTYNAIRFSYKDLKDVIKKQIQE